MDVLIFSDFFLFCSVSGFDLFVFTENIFWPFVRGYFTGFDWAGSDGDNSSNRRVEN